MDLAYHLRIVYVAPTFILLLFFPVMQTALFKALGRAVGTKTEPLVEWSKIPIKAERSHRKKHIQEKRQAGA